MSSRRLLVPCLALAVSARLAAQTLPPPPTGGVVDIEATVGAETRAVRHDYAPPRRAVILAETLRHERHAVPAVSIAQTEAVPAQAGSTTATFVFDAGYAASHPAVVRPVRGASDGNFFGTNRYSRLVLTTTWDGQGVPTFALQATAASGGGVSIIEGRGSGRFLGSGPSNVPSPRVNSLDVTRAEGQVGRFRFGPEQDYRFLYGTSQYWTERQADGTDVVFHTGYFTEPVPGLREYQPIGEVVVAGTPGRAAGVRVTYQTTEAGQPLEAGAAYAALRGENWNFTGDYQPDADTTAGYSFSSAVATASKLRYKIQLQPGLARTVSWTETFTPEGASEPSEHRFVSESVGAGATETTAHTLDPFAWLGDQPGTYEVVAYDGESLAAALTTDVNGDGTIVSPANPITPYLIAHADQLADGASLALAANHADADGDGLPDGTDAVVNGAADLANFIPVYLDLSSLVGTLPPSSGFTYKLKHADEALNFVYTNLTPTTAFAYRAAPESGFGPGLDEPAATADTQQVTAEGVDIFGGEKGSEPFLTAIQRQGGGIILIEARRATTQPLVLTVTRPDGTILVEIALPLVVTAPPSLAVDANRDGQIKLPGEDNADLTSDANPYRFWVNDDDDAGDISATGPSLIGNPDEPGRLSGFWELDGRTPDHDTAEVDGRSDLLDFFPIFLDIKQLLAVLPHTTAGMTYKLKQDDSALNFVYTNLTRAEAFDYLKYNKERVAYGLPSDQKKAYEAPTVAIPATGATLNADFLARIKDETDKGVILVEGKLATDKPLRLVVEKDGAEIAEVALHIKISEVEKMYRWVNTRDVTGQSVTRATDLSQPSGYPDSATNGNMFIFVHGYNVNERQSRAWNAEAFKRMYQSGSRAMFTAVSWNGDHSQIPYIGVAPDYWDNITRAFKTAQALAPIVNSLLASSKVIAGHSMGNAVASAAIVDHGMNVTKYFMVNAAVALEAYDTSALAMDAMRHPDDWPSYERRLWPTDWHALFPPDDGRRGLTWMDRFGNIPNAVNIYSSGEEVLNNNDLTPGEIPPVGAERVWVIQEMAKGTLHLAALLTFDIQGGWGYNSEWLIAETTMPGGPHGSPTTIYRRRAPTEAAALTDAQLMEEPFFRPFKNDDFTSPTGSVAAADPIARADALGGAIPALSFAAGRNPVPRFSATRNRDLMALQDGWPQERLSTTIGVVQGSNPPQGRWFHSDIKNIAYVFNRGAWDLFVTEGNLK